jgi:hypothetical protein
MEPRVRDNGAPETTTLQPARPGKAARIAGWIISAILILWLGVAGTIFALTNRAMVEKNMTDLGYPVSSIMKIQIVLVCCVILYAIPQTAVLGAILLTGYLGGAVATHVRAADGMWFFPIIFGVLVWLGLVLRDPRLRQLVPLRKV